MKTKVLVIILILALMLPVAAQAATPRMARCIPEISYTGLTATCTVRIFADSMSDEIEANITLWYGTTEIESWTATANGYLNFSGNAEVYCRRTHRLTVDYWINGVQQESVSIVKTCPCP
jgi:hypothetical protein